MKSCASSRWKPFSLRPIAINRVVCDRALLKLYASAMLLAFAGCGAQDGPQRAAVTGNITMDGKPLESGVVRFIPVGENKGPSASATISTGSYHLSDADGPVVGTNRVEVQAIDYMGFDLDDEAAFAAKAEGRNRRIMKNPIPPRYNRQSELSVDVKGDAEVQTFDFPLRSSKK